MKRLSQERVLQLLHYDRVSIGEVILMCRIVVEGSRHGFFDTRSFFNKVLFTVLVSFFPYKILLFYNPLFWLVVIYPGNGFLIPLQLFTNFLPSWGVEDWRTKSESFYPFVTRFPLFEVTSSFICTIRESVLSLGFRGKYFSTSNLCSSV